MLNAMMPAKGFKRVGLRPYQYDIRQGVKDEWKEGRPKVLVTSPTGSGKCLGFNTPILMYDGTIKMVQNVAVGDEVMGPDSLPRTVTSTTKGREEMFLVTPVKGEPYTVNRSHILSLKITNLGDERVRSPTGEFICSGDVANVTVDQYLSSSKNFRHLAKGWRSSVEFEQHQIPCPIPPYILGIWLGDGTTGIPCITNPDKEVQDAWKNWAKELGLGVRVSDEDRCPMFFLSNGRRGVGGPKPVNKALDLLRIIEVCDNKHIPHRYLTGSRKERMELLAGLLDTDGSLAHNANYDFISIKRELSDGVAFLARSLGYAAYVSPCQKYCQTGGGGTYYRVSISGDVDELPLRIPRKKSLPRRQKKSVLMTGISLMSVGEGNYYGFTLDGPDRLFLLGDFTVTHNTTTMGAIIADEVDDGGKVLVCTNMQKLTRQFANRTEQDFGIPCGIEMAGEGHGGESVVCATIQTMVNRIQKGKFHPEQFSLLCFDEAHLAMADTFQRVANHFSNARIVGLTATPHRNDRKDLLTFFDSMVEKITLPELIEQKYLAPLTVFNLPIKIKLERDGKGDFKDEEISHAIEPYLASCADALVEHAGDRCILSFLPLIATSQHFTSLLNKRGLKAEHVDGTMGEFEVGQAIKRLEKGDISCLCSSMLLTIGVDIKPVNCILNLRPTRSWTLYVQTVGRGTRTFDPLKDGPKGTKWPLKKDCMLMDPLWLTSDHNLLQRPAVLVAENDEERELMDAKLIGGGGDLMEAKQSAKAEREEKLRKRLEAMQHKASRTINAMELFSKTGHPELLDYEPVARWEMEKPTQNQIDFLLKQKCDMATITTKGMASKMIDVFIQRIRQGLASGGQVKFMIGLGKPEDEAWKMSFNEAKMFLDQNAPPKPAWQRR